ncbi:hypothetical protein [Bradyrhizobium sp. UFLA05-112]
MLNYIEVFDVIEIDPTTGREIWTGLTGTRSALARDGYTSDPAATTCCPREWLDERGYVDVALARKRPRPWSI